MSDRELLELAAKAVGFSMKKYGPSTDGRAAALDNGLFWSPFDDDGDAFRLAVKLGMDVHASRHTKTTWAMSEYSNQAGCVENFENDDLAATRRAIVRAAADIGREMKDGAV